MSKSKRKVNGIKSWVIIIPSIIIVATFHFLIVISIFNINTTSREMSNTMEDCAQNIDDITLLQAGSSILSDTLTSFAYMPYIEETHQVNYAPLIAYSNEYQRPRRPDDIVKKFENVEISNIVRNKINEAADCANALIDDQAYAIALIDSVYHLSNPAITNLPKYDLSADDLALSNEEKLAQATKLVFSEKYRDNKRILSEDMTIITTQIKKDASEKQEELAVEIKNTRQALWFMAFSIIIILIVIVIIMLSLLIYPLVDFAKRIDRDEKLKQRGLYETRFLANAYNKLIDKRNVFEKTLKYAAETDSLTNLPNRFSLNGYLSNIIVENNSIALFLFDINCLKETNDEYGHKAGDELIKRSVKCICDCFGDNNTKNCFRYGGDEFVAILTGINEKQAEDLKNRFLESQSKYDVSIAIGYSLYSDELETDIDQLFNIADQEMYNLKEKMHNNK